jgi:hypothetical protein
MQKKSIYFLIAGLAVAWAVDFLFYKKPVGISVGIWFIVAVLALVVIGWIQGVRPKPPTLILSLFTIAFASAPFFRLEPFTRFTGIGGALFGLMLLASTYKDAQWPWFRLSDYLVRLFLLTAAVFWRAWEMIFPPKPKAVVDDTEAAALQAQPPAKNRAVWPILRGILLALPVLAVFAALLAAADPIFERGLNDFLNLFKIENLPEIFFRIIYVLFFAYLFTGALLHAILPKREYARPNPLKPQVTPFLGFTEAGIVLGSVNALFAMFVFIQFRYFFGGQANISELGYTYSEYARRGFGELITVAIFSLLLYLALSTATRKDTPGQNRLFSTLSVLIFAQVLIILVSTFQRLALYEAAYGFSRLRTYTHLFIPWLGALLLIVMILEIIRRQGFFPLALLTFAAGFTITCFAFNIDGFIARHNIQRAVLSQQEGYQLDFEYLTELSNDVVPALVDGYNTTLEAPGNTHSLLGAALACRMYAFRHQEPQPWQSFNLGDNKAILLLNAQHAEWDKYTLSFTAEDYRGIAVHIGKEIHYCSNNNGFMD